MLQFAIEFLGGRCHAARWSDPTQADWPIDPARVFSALVAAAHRFDNPIDVAAARAWLGWLERLPAPTIYAVQQPPKLNSPHSHCVRPVIARNAKRQTEEINPKTDDVYLTSIPLLDPVLLLRYEASLDPEDRPIVEQLVANVSYLGSSESLVHMRLTDEEPHLHHCAFRPQDDGKFKFAIPTPGRLAHLDSAFADLQRTDREPWEPRILRPARLASYGDGKVAVPVFIRSSMNEMISLRFLSHLGHRYGPALDIWRFGLATAGVRAAFLSRLGDDAPPELTGHDAPDVPTKRNHVAFVPLAEVGFPHARSVLRGVALVFPGDMSAELRAHALKAFNLNTVTIRGQEWPVEIDANPALMSLQPTRYLEISEAWVTATPIILPRYPKRSEPVPDILALAAQHAGLPAPIEVTTSQVPFVEGAYSIAAYRGQLRDRPYLVHARMRFPSRIKGPVLLGKHRHQGFGLCLPEHSAAKEMRA